MLLLLLLLEYWWIYPLVISHVAGKSQHHLLSAAPSWSLVYIKMVTYCGWKKSCTTWDGRKPINNGINHLLTGAGFLPSTDIPSGKLPHNYGKSPFLTGKLTISMAIFNSYVSLPEGIPWYPNSPNKYPEKTQYHQINSSGFVMVCWNLLMFNPNIPSPCQHFFVKNHVKPKNNFGWVKTHSKPIFYWEKMWFSMFFYSPAITPICWGNQLIHSPAKSANRAWYRLTWWHPLWPPSRCGRG